MNRNSIIEKLKDILKDNQFLALKSLIDTIDDETSLINDLALDSIQILELLVSIEEKFNFSCNSSELNLDIFDRFGSLVDFIENKLECA